MRTFKGSVLLLSLLALPAAAGAQATHAFVSPYFGSTSGGGDLSKSGAPAVGVAAGWKSAGWWGFEGDLSGTPGFFAQDDFRIDRFVMTAMGNALVAVLKGERAVGVHVAGGVGLIRVQLAEAGRFAAIDVKQLGFNVGAGASWMKNGRGIRGDVRYFRSVGDEEDDANAFGLEVSNLHFVRASVGVVVGF